MNEKIINYYKLVLIVLLIIGVGMFAINQSIRYIGYSKAIQDPCGTCISISENSHLLKCFQEPVVKNYYGNPLGINFSTNNYTSQMND